MEFFLLPVQVRWSDMDPNFHLRHSVYYDWGALCRVEFLYKYELTADVMMNLQFGPILFREECVFKKEIRMGDVITIDVQLLKIRPDFSRWSIQHNIRKNGDETAAILTVDGAWMDVLQRKLTVPPDTVQHVFEKMSVGVGPYFRERQRSPAFTDRVRRRSGEAIKVLPPVGTYKCHIRLASQVALPSAVVIVVRGDDDVGCAL